MNACIIKLGADGDVLRTLPLAKAIHEEKKATITWITKGDISTLLEGLPYIKRVITLENIQEIEDESFDILYNFDVDEEALELAEVIQSDKKYGFYDADGYPVAYNSGGEYYLNTMFDDDLKKTNKKTYQEMMFEVAEMPFKKERCSLKLNKEDQVYAKSFADSHTLKGKKIIGIHMGSSSRWPSKTWHLERVQDFIQIANKKGYEIILFGGPNEVDKHALLVEHLHNAGLKVYRNDPRNTKREFASLVSLCDLLVCGDSFSLHVALGLGIKSVVLFFVTSPAEVETYGLSIKIESPLLKEFFPERSNEYNEQLVKSISAEEVMGAVDKLHNKT
ncbi:glycosyltransferase family 9 protein [Candidatus Pacearchaeota archaeon]|nr:glycosyltransferase family 9 protein [Candidatus Pacearchaeota archaeon]